jgi:peptidoglycan-associated lipoprotein
MRIPNAARGLHAIGFAVLLFTVGACAPKPAPKPPEPPPAPVSPPPARPTVTLQASPTFIQQGEATTLSWSSTNATSLTLSGSGGVAPEGSSKVSPAESTTYSITASGPGGTADASVRVTVSAPPPPPPPAQPVATIEELFRTNVLDAFFDYNKSDIRPDARDALARTAEFLRGNAQIKVNIEGHCDERGSTEYNLGLGDRRAQAVKDFLVSLGVSADRLNTVSMGKERPFCTESNESCWQQNRRGHFVLAAR